VSGQDAPSDEGLPSPTFDEKSGDSPTSLDAEAIVSQIRNQLAKDVQEQVERKFKSATDKRFSKLDKIGNVADLLADLQNNGVEIPDNLKTEYRIRELEERLESKPAQAKDDIGVSSQTNAVTDALAEMAKYQLDTNTPEFIALLKGQYRNRDAFDAAVAKHIVGRLAPQKQASPSGAAASAAVGGAKTGDFTVADYDRQKVEIMNENISHDDRLRKLSELQTKAMEEGII
jgi:BMFP domain-containing protein YqiC